MYQPISLLEFTKLHLSHLKWLEDGTGEQLILNHRDLSYLNLSDLNLEAVNLSNCDLRGVNFSRSILVGASLSNSLVYGANFYQCNLRGANLRNIDFYNVNLQYANLKFASVEGSDFFRAKVENATLENIKDHFPVNGYPLSCPEKGSFVGFKKADKYIIELLIPEDAKRSSAFGRKCRCDKAQVKEIYHLNGAPAEIDFVVSDYDKNFIYKRGEMVYSDFDDYRWRECSEGIHFFITQQEALYS